MRRFSVASVKAVVNSGCVDENSGALPLAGLIFVPDRHCPTRLKTLRPGRFHSTGPDSRETPVAPPKIRVAAIQTATSTSGCSGFGRIGNRRGKLAVPSKSKRNCRYAFIVQMHHLRVRVAHRKQNPMHTLRLIIANRRGLHAQACARIVHIALDCRCNLSIVAKGRRVSAHNIVAVMLMTATMGAIRIEADGPDEVATIQQIVTLFHDGLGERR
jgi:phosphotransferase system HPr (HPr) family protein